MATSTAQQERLHVFAGNWHVLDDVESLQIGNANAAQCVTTAHWDVALLGQFVIGEIVQTRDSVEVFRAHHVFGWDQRINKYTLHFFDSEGANPPTRAEGTWTDDVLNIEQHTPFGFVCHEYSFTNDDSFIYRLSTSDYGEEWLLQWEGNFQRVTDS